MRSRWPERDDLNTSLLPVAAPSEHHSYWPGYPAKRLCYWPGYPAKRLCYSAEYLDERHCYL